MKIFLGFLARKRKVTFTAEFIKGIQQKPTQLKEGALPEKTMVK